jgi:hypothetical protein
MSTAPAVRFCQSFKKYSPEHRPEVVAFAKDWARAKGAAVFEDRSLVKVTADQATIESLRAEITAKFPEWTPVGIEGSDDKKKK